QSVTFEKQHPLFDLGAVADVKSTNSSLAKGVFIPNLNSGNLKQSTVKVSSRQLIDGSVSNQLSFKVCFPAREELETHLKFIQQNFIHFKKTICSGLCSDIIILPKNESYWSYEKGSFDPHKSLNIADSSIIEINFVGLGKIQIGSDPSQGCSYNR